MKRNRYLTVHKFREVKAFAATAISVPEEAKAVCGLAEVTAEKAQALIDNGAFFKKAQRLADLAASLSNGRESRLRTQQQARKNQVAYLPKQLLQSVVHKPA